MVNVGGGVEVFTKMTQGFHLAHITLGDNMNKTLCNRTWCHELTLPSAKCCERCHPRLYPPELQCL